MNEMMNTSIRGVTVNTDEIPFLQPIPDVFPDITALRAAAKALVEKLRMVHADPRYVGVYALAGNHGAPYTGPTYEAELAALKKALEEDGGDYKDQALKAIE